MKNNERETVAEWMYEIYTWKKKKNFYFDILLAKRINTFYIDSIWGQQLI